LRDDPDPPIDYVQRMNRAIDHVLAHLAQPLPLEQVADAAAFSPYHFHRIFRSMMGETLNQFARRLRLDRADRGASRLLDDRQVDVLPTLGRVQDPVAVDSPVTDVLRRVEHDPTLARVDQLEVPQVGKK
jgi:AraC-like DNA-binding protein